MTTISKPVTCWWGAFDNGEVWPVEVLSIASAKGLRFLVAGHALCCDGPMMDSRTCLDRLAGEAPGLVDHLVGQWSVPGSNR
jgi:hypothetical protein